MTPITTEHRTVACAALAVAAQSDGAIDDTSAHLIRTFAYAVATPAPPMTLDEVTTAVRTHYAVAGAGHLTPQALIDAVRAERLAAAKAARLTSNRPPAPDPVEVAAATEYRRAVRSVPCPEPGCGAAVGAPCMNPTRDRPYHGPGHLSRARAGAPVDLFAAAR